MPEPRMALPRPRTLVHPGPFSPRRIEHMEAAGGQHLRLSIPPQAILHDALVDAMSRHGVACASMTLIGGHFSTFSFCFAGADPSGEAVVRYSAPMTSQSTRLLFGNATLGKSQQGRPIVHCHAVFQTDDGVIAGGHVLTDRCRVVHTPVTVLATSLEGFELRLQVDEETRTPLLRPLPEPSHG